MNIFFTFLFDIKRISVPNMVHALTSLVKSLDYFKNSYELHVYTNVPIRFDNPNIKIIKYELSDIIKYYNNVWHDISFHKLSTAKTFTEKGISPIWIDLDTIVCRNVDHLSDYNNFFVKQGGSMDTKIFNILPGLGVENKDYIQGNIWKINPALLNLLMELWDSLTTKPEYDTQGLFNYAYHFKDMKSNMLILGEDVDHNTINGLDIVNDKIVTHPTISLLKDNLVMRDGKIISLNSNKEIQFFSFTFLTLVDFFSRNLFAQFSDPGIRDFFKSCGYIYR